MKPKTNRFINPNLFEMKKITTLVIILFAGIIMFTGCKKDDDTVLPTVSLKNATGYISANTQAAYGDTLNFGITATGNGTDNLAKFTIYVNDSTVFDSTMNTQKFTFDCYAVKGIAPAEVWKFVTKDITGNEGIVSITITGQFGELDSYAGITLGAQNNAAVESFISYSNNAATKYFQAAAFDHQADIDMFCFYENTTAHQNYMTLAAPGSGITGIFTGGTAPDSYTTKNVTYFVKTTLTAAEFDAVTNDAVVLNSFDPNNKFKKAKALAAGEVYAFKLQSGKYGLFKVTNVTGVEDGTLQMDVKVQK
jgi:hypothetical protein